MAAPSVSGAAVVLLQQHPNLTPDQVTARLMKTASKTLPASSVAVFGNTTYVCGANRITIVDTSNAGNPLLVGSFGGADLAGNGGKCVLNTGSGTPILVDILVPANTPSFVVYDVTNPRVPPKVGQIAPARFNFFADLTFVGTTGAER